MEENKKIETIDNIDAIVQNEEESSFDFRTIFTAVYSYLCVQRNDLSALHHTGLSGVCEDAYQR